MGHDSPDQPSAVCVENGSAPPRPARLPLLAVLTGLLQEPASILANGGRSLLWLAGLALLATALYGAAAGFFQGGGQIAVATLKAPLILFGSLALCLPSFFVFTTLAGARWRPAAFAAAASGLTALLALLLLALLPVAWLFTLSSRHLLFVVFLHLAVWCVALAFGHRLLTAVVEAVEGRGGAQIWLLLLLVVSLQMTTTLRPVLWRAESEPLFHFEKRSFLEELSAAAKISHPLATAAEKPPAAAAGEVSP